MFLLLSQEGEQTLGIFDENWQLHEIRSDEANKIKIQLFEDQGVEKALQGVQQGAGSLPVSRWLLSAPAANPCVRRRWQSFNLS